MNTMLAIDIIKGVVPSDNNEEIEAWQHLISTNQVWNLDWEYRKIAIRLLEEGFCALGRSGSDD